MVSYGAPFPPFCVVTDHLRSYSRPSWSRGRRNRSERSEGLSGPVTRMGSEPNVGVGHARSGYPRETERPAGPDGVVDDDEPRSGRSVERPLECRLTSVALLRHGRARRRAGGLPPLRAPGWPPQHDGGPVGVVWHREAHPSGAVCPMSSARQWSYGLRINVWTCERRGARVAGPRIRDPRTRGPAHPRPAARGVTVRPRCAVKGAVPQRVRIPPGNCRVWTPPDCQAFLSRLVLQVRALEVIRDNGAARQSLALAPVERGPAFRLALKVFPHGRPRQSPTGPQRSGGAAQRLDGRGRPCAR